MILCFVSLGEVFYRRDIISVRDLSLDSAVVCSGLEKDRKSDDEKGGKIVSIIIN